VLSPSIRQGFVYWLRIEGLYDKIAFDPLCPGALSQPKEADLSFVKRTVWVLDGYLVRHCKPCSLV
jgi:hypothetical protein